MCHVSHVYRLKIRVIMRWYRGLCTDLLAFAIRMRKTARLYMKAVQSVISSKRTLTSNEVSRFAQCARKGEEGKKERTENAESMLLWWSFGTTILTNVSLISIISGKYFQNIINLLEFVLIYSNEMRKSFDEITKSSQSLSNSNKTNWN